MTGINLTECARQTMRTLSSSRFIFVGGRPGEGSRAVLMGPAWIINAVVAEYVIRTRFTTNGGTTSRRARPVLLSTIVRSAT
jgi:hypothetical protein